MCWNQKRSYPITTFFKHESAFANNCMCAPIYTHTHTFDLFLISFCLYSFQYIQTNFEHDDYFIFVLDNDNDYFIFVLAFRHQT